MAAVWPTCGRITRCNYIQRGWVGGLLKPNVYIDRETDTALWGRHQRIELYSEAVAVIKTANAFTISERKIMESSHTLRTVYTPRPRPTQNTAWCHKPHAMRIMNLNCRLWKCKYLQPIWNACKEHEPSASPAFWFRPNIENGVVGGGRWYVRMSNVFRQVVVCKLMIFQMNRRSNGHA